MRPENTVSSTTASDAEVGNRRAVKLGGECGRHGTDEMIVSPPVLLPSEPEAVDAREPAGLRVERLGHALAGSADAEGKIEWGMPTLGDDTLDLLGQREDHHPLGVSFQEGEEGAGEVGGGGGGTETRRHFVAQIVVDVQQSRRGLRVGPAVRLVRAAGRLSRRHPLGPTIDVVASTALHHRAHVLAQLLERRPSDIPPAVVDPMNREIRQEREGERQGEETVPKCRRRRLDDVEA